MNILYNIILNRYIGHNIMALTFGIYNRFSAESN